jgi:uncharacterized alpha-E superfamily protein
MLSRVADSLFWMSRYLERAENTARILNVHLNLMLEQSEEASRGRWPRVRRSLGLEAPAQLTLEDDATEFVHSLSYDLGNRSSIVSSIMGARDNARQVREQISSEMWEQLNRLFHEVRKSDHEEYYTAEPMDFLNAVKEGAHLFQGLTDSTMSHGEGWQFIEMGRYLERAYNTAVLVNVHFAEFVSTGRTVSEAGPDAADYLEWIGLLRCATAFEAYCKVYTASIDPNRVAEFLLLNSQFPHSLKFSVDRMQQTMAAVAEISPSRRGAGVHRLAGRLKASLDFAQVEEVMAGGLAPFLEDIRRQCGGLHSAIYQAYIRYPIETALEA